MSLDGDVLRPQVDAGSGKGERRARASQDLRKIPVSKHASASGCTNFSSAAAALDMPVQFTRCVARAPGIGRQSITARCGRPAGSSLSGRLRGSAALRSPGTPAVNISQVARGTLPHAVASGPVATLDCAAVGGMAGYMRMQWHYASAW
jgi:hypothetical protein